MTTPAPLSPAPRTRPLFGFTLRMTRAQARAFLRGIGIGVCGGALCAWAHTPLPWLIGSLVAVAVCSASGVDLFAPQIARAAGQWAIGTALGLYFTPEVVQRLLQYGVPILVGVAWSLLVGTGAAWCLRRFAGVDPPTAFFAGAVGGASEMALQGERNGGRVETIAAAHSLRIMMVVVLLPFLYQGLGLHGSDPFVAGVKVYEPVGLLYLVAATVGGALLLAPTGLPNVWVLAPLLVAAVLTSQGITWSALPVWLVNAGQVSIGVALGTRFRPGFFSRAPRLMTVVALSTLGVMGASAVFATLAGWVFGIAPATMVLATAPGGIAEMSLTAKLLQLGVPVVTVFHVTRLVGLVLLASAFYRALARRFGWPIGRPPGATVSSF